MADDRAERYAEALRRIAQIANAALDSGPEQRVARVDAALARQLGQSIAENARLTKRIAELERRLAGNHVFDGGGFS